jgi:hypothetical protein
LQILEKGLYYRYGILFVINIKTKMTESSKTAKPTLKKTPSVDPEVVKKHQQMINFLRNEISSVEVELKKMKVILDQLVNFDPMDIKSLTSMEGDDPM